MTRLFNADFPGPVRTEWRSENGWLTLPYLSLSDEGAYYASNQRDTFHVYLQVSSNISADRVYIVLLKRMIKTRNLLSIVTKSYNQDNEFIIYQVYIFFFQTIILHHLG